jgi:hypothetical protein
MTTGGTPHTGRSDSGRSKVYHPWYGLPMATPHAPAPAAPAASAAAWDEIAEPVLDAIEIVLCSDCAIVIANGDTSGLGDRADAHLAAMDRELAGYDVIIGFPADLGFRTDTCGGCGTYTATDDWFAAELRTR